MKKRFVYEKMPTRGNVASDGEIAKKHVAKPHGISCGGNVYISYDENRWYSVHCENCGEIAKLRTKSMDWAIKIWNDMPDAVGY